MATYVEAGGTGILIDPGATLAPSRYGLPPSAEEWEALKRSNDRISAYAARARYVFVSHYHEDHFRSDPATYAGRVVLVKDPRRMVTGAQSRRAEALWKALDGPARIQRLWETGRVITAAAHLGLTAQPLEARRDRLWAAVRKPPARLTPAARATMTRERRKSAKGGVTE